MTVMWQGGAPSLCRLWRTRSYMVASCRPKAVRRAERAGQRVVLGIEGSICIHGGRAAGWAREKPVRGTISPDIGSLWTWPSVD